MKRPSKKSLLAVAICGTLLGTALYASANCWVHTSCGRTVMTISETDENGQRSMSETDYDKYLRDVNEAYCGNRNRPNVSHQLQ